MKNPYKFIFSVFLYISIVLFAGAVIPLSSEEILSTGLIIESQDELDAEEADVMPMVRSGSKKLPERFDLSAKMPPVGSQGRQGSCVAWSTTYYVKSYHEKIKNRWKYGWGNYNPFYKSGIIDAEKGSHVFSPAWTYNQINGGRDRGSSISKAFRLLTQKGAVPWSVMPYNHKDYQTQPDSKKKRLALKYKAKSYTRVITTDPANIKREIAAGNPVVGGFKVTSKWKRPSRDVSGGGVQDDHTGNVTGGHAMAVVGYDDNKVSPAGHKGAFRIINSWGHRWGNNGYFWMSYRCFTMLCKYAYVLYDSDASSVPEEAADDKTVKSTTMITATKGIYSDKIIVSWNPVENAVSYIVERSAGDSKSFNRVAVVKTGRYTDSEIQPDFRYNYRIITVAVSGRSTAESSLVAEGFALKRNSNLPAQVTGLRGYSATGSSVVLKWNSVQNSRIYAVVKYDQLKRKWNLIGRTASLSFQDKRPGRRFPNYYYVAAVNRAGQGKWSNLFRISVSKTGGRPARVTGMKASRGRYSDRIHLKWNRQVAASDYLLLRWNSKLKKWDKRWKVKSNSFTDRNVKKGSRYIYTAKAMNSRGISKAWGNYVTGYTSRRLISFNVRSGMGAPAPESVKAKVDKKSRTVALTWKSSSMIAKYSVYRKKDSDKKFKLIKTLPMGTTSYSEAFPGDDGDIFMYNVTARVVGGESESSKTVSATIEEFNPTVMTTFIPGDGLKNFRGIWRASHLKKGGKSVKMEITVADNGSRFSAKIKYGNIVKSINGDYASKSLYLETKDFSFRMLPAFDNDLANVVIPAGVFTPSRIVVNFARENQD